MNSRGAESVFFNNQPISLILIKVKKNDASDNVLAVSPFDWYNNLKR
jgi:hypothetical protein